jgi:hypothetical protein
LIDFNSIILFLGKKTSICIFIPHGPWVRNGQKKNEVGAVLNSTNNEPGLKMELKSSINGMYRVRYDTFPKLFLLAAILKEQNSGEDNKIGFQSLQ